MVLSQPCQVKYLSNVSPCCLLVIQSCPTLCYPWTAAYQAPLSMEFPSKNTAVGYHSLFQQVFWTQRSNPGLLHRKQILYCLSYQILAVKWVKVAQSCLTLCDPMDYTVHGILQARILEWVAFPFSRGSSQSRDWTQVSHIADFFTSWTTRKVQEYRSGYPMPSPADLPDPGIELGSPALQVGSLPAELWGKTSPC